MRAMLMIGLVSLCGVCFGQEAGPQGKNQAEKPDAFDRWLGDGSTIAEWRSWWETMLDAQIRSDGRRYSLTAEEQRKLRAAGRRDLSLMFDRLEAACVELNSIDSPDGLAAVHVKILKLRDHLRRGTFDDDSAYEKVLRKMKESRAIRFSLSPDRI